MYKRIPRRDLVEKGKRDHWLFMFEVRGAGLQDKSARPSSGILCVICKTQEQLDATFVWKRALLDSIKEWYIPHMMEWNASLSQMIINVRGSTVAKFGKQKKAPKQAVDLWSPRPTLVNWKMLRLTLTASIIYLALKHINAILPAIDIYIHIYTSSLRGDRVQIVFLSV